jgi:large subunit ribosomal protein L24
VRLPKPRSHTKLKLFVRRDDQVAVISGKDRGKRGKVLRVDRDRGRVVVEGVNIARRHQKPTQKLLQGGVVEQENPVAASTVMVICGNCKQPTRVGHLIREDGRNVRKCLRCGKAIDK